MPNKWIQRYVRSGESKSAIGSWMFRLKFRKWNSPSHAPLNASKSHSSWANTLLLVWSLRYQITQKKILIYCVCLFCFRKSLTLSLKIVARTNCVLLRSIRKWIRRVNKNEWSSWRERERTNHIFKRKSHIHIYIFVFSSFRCNDLICSHFARALPYPFQRWIAIFQRYTTE